MKSHYTGVLTIIDSKGNVETSRFNEKKSKGDLHFVTVIVKTANTYFDLAYDELKNSTIQFAYEGDFADVVKQMFDDLQERTRTHKKPWMPKLSWAEEPRNQ